MTISATTQGLRPGVCTSTSRPSVPFDGMLIYETDTNRVAVYDTNTWVYKTPASTTGSVLQVVSTTKTDTFTTTSGTFVDVTGMSATITPSSTSSNVLVVVSMPMMDINGNQTMKGKVVRGSTDVFIGDAVSGNTRTTFSLISVGYGYGATWAFVDSPSTTSATTYKVQASVTAANSFYLNRDRNDDNNGASSIILMEIAG